MNFWLIFWLVAEVTLNIPNVVEGAQYFTDNPPDDYYLRKSMGDCRQRFYPDVDYTRRRVPGYGGKQALYGEFQHMVSLGWNTSNGIEYFCGGSLISTRFILTAAHCAADKKGNPPTIVRLGHTKLVSTENDTLSLQMNILTFKRHPHHNISKKYHDIALVELETDVELNVAICPTCLWLEKFAPTEPMEAIGFGITGIGHDLSPTLQKFTLSEISNDDCMKRITKHIRGLPDGLIDAQFCAAGDNQDTCEGDSGGPILIPRAFYEAGYRIVLQLIVGIVSFGSLCIKGSTGVYTRVEPYKDWIEQETRLSFSISDCVSRISCPSWENSRKKYWSIERESFSEEKGSSSEESYDFLEEHFIYSGDFDYSEQSNSGELDYSEESGFADEKEENKSTAVQIQQSTEINNEIYRNQPTNLFHRVGLLWNHPLETNTLEFKCGGTLIDYRYVLTSAYCVYFRKSFPKFISAKGQIVDVESVHVHPGYTLENPQNDLALIKLAKYLNPSFNLRPACFWHKPTNNKYTATFSALRGGKYSNINFGVTGDTKENGNCSSSFNGSEELFCRISPYWVSDDCVLDYGGPVKVYGDNQIEYISGVVSSLSGRCDEELVEIKVEPHVEWIEDVILGHNIASSSRLPCLPVNLGFLAAMLGLFII